MKSIVYLLIVATLAFGSGCAKEDWIERTLVTVDVTGRGMEAWAEKVPSPETSSSSSSKRDQG